MLAEGMGGIVKEVEGSSVDRGTASLELGVQYLFEASQHL